MAGFQITSRGYETLCKMALFFFLPQPGLLRTVPDSLAGVC